MIFYSFLLDSFWGLFFLPYPYILGWMGAAVLFPFFLKDAAFPLFSRLIRLSVFPFFNFSSLAFQPIDLFISDAFHESEMFWFFPQNRVWVKISNFFPGVGDSVLQQIPCCLGSFSFFLVKVMVQRRKMWSTPSGPPPHEWAITQLVGKLCDFIATIQSFILIIFSSRNEWNVFVFRLR